MLEEQGFVAVRNKPYAGGFITEHYGRPARGLHALQIEVNRSLYIDESSLRKKSDFDKVALSIRSFIQSFSNEVCRGGGDVSLAAE